MTPEARFEVCRACPDLVGPLDNCRHCWCFMRIKVHVPSASCPIGKWGPVESDGPKWTERHDAGDAQGEST